MVKPKIRILQVGYYNECPTDKSKFTADCTVSLIERENASPVLVDTSGPWNAGKLKDAINQAGYDLADIKTVICTHGHSDHIGNLNLFPDAWFLVGYDIFRGNVYEAFDFKSPSAKYEISERIYVLPTPGHTHSDVSVVVRDTDIGTVVIAGDLFESGTDYLNDGEVWKSLSEDIDMQNRNREKILDIADYIVPGHGDMFNVEDFKRNQMKNVTSVNK